MADEITACPFRAWAYSLRALALTVSDPALSDDLREMAWQYERSARERDRSSGIEAGRVSRAELAVTTVSRLGPDSHHLDPSEEFESDELRDYQQH